MEQFLYQMHKNGDRCIGKIAEQNDSRSYKTIGHGTSKGCMRLQLRQYTHGPHQEYILHSTNSICVFAHFITTIKVYWLSLYKLFVFNFFTKCTIKHMVNFSWHECIYIYYHTVQVTRAQVRYLRQWVEGKTPPAQVTMGETTTCASGVFVPIAEGETPPP